MHHIYQPEKMRADQAPELLDPVISRFVCKADGIRMDIPLRQNKKFIVAHLFGGRK